jgi:hypothetical protein
VSLDAAVRKAAKTVLAKFGTSTVIRRVTSTAYDTTTGKMAPVTTDTTVKGRFEEYTDRQFSETIKAGDRKLTIAAEDLTFTPSPAEKVVTAGIVYQIVNVKQEMATDQAALYTLQLRR